MGPVPWVGIARGGVGADWRHIPRKHPHVLTLSLAASQGNTQLQPEAEPEVGAQEAAHGTLPVRREAFRPHSVRPSVQPLLSFSTHTRRPTCSDQGLLQPTEAPCSAHSGPVSRRA